MPDIPDDPFGKDEDTAEELRSLQRVVAFLQDELEAQQLKFGGEQRDLLLREIKQRIRARLLASILGIVVILGMALLLWHVTHLVFTKPWWWPMGYVPSQSLAVVLFAAPVASITSITIMFLIGAFRRFKDDDLGVDKVALANEAANTVLGG